MRKKVFIGVALLLVATMLAACGGIPQEDYDAVVADKDAAEAKVTSLTSQLTAAKSEATKAKSDLAAAQSELTAAQSDLEAAQSELASAKSAASSAQSAASKAKSDLTAAEATIAELETTIAELEAAAAAPEEEEEVAEEEEEAVEEEEEEVVELSFTPTEYVNEEYGFSVKYPSDWTMEPGVAEAPTVLWLGGAPYKIPAISVSVDDAEEGVSLADYLAASHEEAGNSDWEVKEESESTTADGSPATYIVGYYFAATGYDIDCAYLVAQKDGKWLIVSVYTVSIYAPFSVEQMSEVVHTLTFQ